ncbi:helix-turn-helix transcriptional regulator [Halovivax cerinus]|uniref:Helix-turn-helix transcriptional regulator n=1 Tax=Halovivax cerinus TaxID=1487865 RepID=A0ABD5NSP1_9EURY|nr:hypothetical protein [Halovivax cerinus]
MAHRSWVVTGLVILLASGSWVAVGPAMADGAGSVSDADAVRSPAGASATVAETGDPAFPGVTYEAVEIDSIVLSIDLTTEGTANWRVEHRVRLDDPNATAGFERTRRKLRQNRSAFRDPFADSIRSMATTAQAETGRAMVVENVAVEAHRDRLPQEYGVVAYEFRWHGFAATGKTLRAGDALAGLFLDDVTTLVIGWPAATEPVDLAPNSTTTRDNAAVWRGPLEFASGEPRVVLASETHSFGPDYTAPRSNDAVLTVATIGAVLGGLGAAIVVRRRRTNRAPDAAQDRTEGATQTGGPIERESATESEGPIETEGPVEREEATETPHGAAYADPETETASSDHGSRVADRSRQADHPGADRTADGDSPDTARTADGDLPAADRTDPEPLLSNEERVLELVEARGGRVKQQDVVAAFGWSETKTSEVVGELRAADAVSVYRLGRENVLALPEVALDRPDRAADEETGDDE